MANEQSSIVNQRLYFCGIHLDCLSSALKAQKTPKVVVQQSLGESIVLHLMLTYRAYLQEIALAYNVSNATTQQSFDTSSELVEFLSGQDCQSAEAQELLMLEDNDSWLTQLLLKYHQLGNSQFASMSRARTGQPDQQFTLAQIDNEQSLDLETCEYYFHQLKAVIENQRTRLEEW